jgi:AcrR family transcriptional regulator
VAAIASSARVGKQTLCSRYPDKAALFREVVGRRIDRMLLAAGEIHADDPLVGIEVLGRTALAIALDPDFLTLKRIVIAHKVQHEFERIQRSLGAVSFVESSAANSSILSTTQSSAGPCMAGSQGAWLG